MSIVISPNDSIKLEKQQKGKGRDFPTSHRAPQVQMEDCDDEDKTDDEIDEDEMDDDETENQPSTQIRNQPPFPRVSPP